MCRIRYIIGLCLLAGLTACTPRSVREAGSVSAETDSSTLAESVTALAPWRWCYPAEYAKVNYFYGRKLRAAGRYTDAVQCFMDAVRVKSGDAVLTGKVYTNMADICHLEGSYELSYLLFGRAATAFLSASDTTAYAYSLCDMAVEAVQQGNFDTADSLLTEAEYLSVDSALLAHCLFTRAILCRHAKQYDEAIAYINRSQQFGIVPSAGYVVKAQSFFHLGQRDSAVYYASEVIRQSQSLFEWNNMYYILAHDSGQHVETVLQLNAQRADIQKAIEVRQGELSRAVDRITQYLEKPYDRQLLYLVVVIAVAATACFFLFRIRRHKKHIRQDILTQLALRERQSEVQRMRHQTAVENFEHHCALLRDAPDLARELAWNDYNRMCEIVNGQLFFLAGKLKQTGVLNEKEVRLCILVAINVSYKQMADLLPYALTGISKFKYSTAQKLNVSVKGLRRKLVRLAVEDYENKL